MIDLRREGDVFVLRLDAGENRFNSEMIRAWNDALDEVEACEGPKALVTTGTGKFYSNGLDLDYMREVDAALAFRYFAGELVLFRSSAGTVRLFDAYRPHMNDVFPANASERSQNRFVR